jgi:hypothetical protein
LPRPTSSRQPTIERTWWWRKLRAAASISIVESRRVTVNRSSVFTGLSDWQWTERKVVKS